MRKEETSFFEIFNKKNLKKKNTTPLRDGVIFIVVFWTSFVLFWTGMDHLSSSSPKVATFPNNKAQGNVFTQATRRLQTLFSNFRPNEIISNINTAGAVLGITNMWNDKTAQTHFLENIEKIKNSSAKGTYVATWELDSVFSDEQDTTATISTQYDTKENITFIDYNTLGANTLQVFQTDDKILYRSDSSEYWQSYKPDPSHLESSVFSNIELLTQVSANNDLIRDQLTFVGEEEVSGENSLRLRISLSSEEFERYFAASESPTVPKDVLFEDFNLDFWVGIKSSRLLRIKSETQKVFIGERQYNTKKTVDYLDIGSAETDLKSLIPTRELIKSSDSTTEFDNIFLRFFSLL